jgi:hypothetical protein
VGLAIAHRAADGCADRRVVARLGAVGALVDDVVPVAGEHGDEVSLQFVPGVVGPDRNP